MRWIPSLNKKLFNPRTVPALPGVLILIGDSPNKRKDYTLLHGMYPDAKLMTVNRAANHFTPDYMVTLHNDRLDEFRKPEGCLLYTPNNNENHYKDVDGMWDFEPMCGTSSLFAAAVALGLGYKEIVIGGVELTEHPWNSETVTHCWANVWYPILKDYARAVSGLPREIYGSPIRR